MHEDGRGGGGSSLLYGGYEISRNDISLKFRKTLSKFRMCGEISQNSFANFVSNHPSLILTAVVIFCTQHLYF
jgi:hypothetical protein